MRKHLITFLILTALTSPALAAGAKTYQVTGPVTAINDSVITVQKGDEQWQINRSVAHIPDSVKVGSKVTVDYSMSAVKVTPKKALKPKQ